MNSNVPFGTYVYVDKFLFFFLIFDRILTRAIDIVTAILYPVALIILYPAVTDVTERACEGEEGESTCVHAERRTTTEKLRGEE